ncbi:MAG: DUF3500 domain-containing protein [Woeseia sp.]
MRRKKKHGFPAQAMLFAVVAGGLAFAQQSDRQQRFKDMSREAEARGLAEPFAGITANGEFVYGLFPIESTGVSTAPVVRAARIFIETLSVAQRGRTVFPVDDPEWRKWMNQHFYVRQGMSFDEMSGEQRDAAQGLLAAGLSVSGLQLTRDIMRLNHTLGELNDNNFEEYGEGLYSITVMGEPSDTEPWGWQLDGHHLVINYFVLGDQVVMTPLFLGSEPVVAESGKYSGTAILQKEQDDGLALLRSLSDAQQQMAIVDIAKTGNNNIAEAFSDNVDLEYAGIPGALLSAEQKKRLLQLIDLYVANLRDAHATLTIAKVEQHLDDTYFAWIGESEEDAVFYYRIFSPVILIEFDHQKPANLRHLYPPAPNRQHIHVVVRTPNGNDYGKDLLRQHYALHPHDQ